MRIRIGRLRADGRAAWRLAVALLLVVLPSCPSTSQQEDAVGQGAKQSAAEETAGQFTSPRGFPSPGPHPVPPTSSPGAAWFGTREKGLVRLDAEGFHHVMVAPTHVQQMVPALPSGLWVLSQYRLFRVDGDRVEPIATDATWGPIERITSGPKGEVWTVASKRIGRFDGQSWSYLDRAEVAPNREAVTIKDIDVDSFGRIYLCSKSSIYVMQESEWREIALNLENKNVLVGLTLFQDANAWLLTRQEVFHIGRTRWNPIHKQLESPGFRRLTVGPEGSWFLEDGLILLQGDGAKKPWPRLDLSQEPVRAKRIRSSHVDSAGRVWMGTDRGVVILDSGGLLTFWPKSALPLLDSDVRALYVQGSGPRLPAVGQ